MNHSPGPWHCTPHPEYPDTARTRIDYVAGAEWGHFGEIAYVRPHNSHIIAAAPDLLEACEDALESIRSGELYTVHLQEILSTAIAKAKGEK